MSSPKDVPDRKKSKNLHGTRQSDTLPGRRGNSRTDDQGVDFIPPGGKIVQAMVFSIMSLSNCQTRTLVTVLIRATSKAGGHSSSPAT